MAWSGNTTIWKLTANQGLGFQGQFNFFVIHDVKDYDFMTPCELLFSEQDDEHVSPGTLVLGTFKLTFDPMNKYGACELTLIPSLLLIP